ncbi:hypothetical protein O1M54_49030 [Streptomyces diastatochromogenes]|nr:hypothetical protein [Streptomyces diastatochromogenes]
MRSGMFEVDHAELYHEIRGGGPALLLISGAGGDAGYYSAVADELADAFTVITYDRRGNSRSTGRNGTPMRLAQQAADARELVEDWPAAGRWCSATAAARSSGSRWPPRIPRWCRG